MSVNIFKTKEYWQNAIKMGLLFILAITILQCLISLFRIDFSTFVQLNFEEGRWKKFLLSRSIGGLFYGMWMAFRVSRKQLKRKQ